MFSAIQDRLHWLSKSGLPMDKVSFVFCMVLCLPLGAIYRTLLHPSRVSPTSRRWASLTWGLAIGFICCGSQLMNLVAVSALCYALLWTVDPRHVHKVVFVVSFTCLSISQWWRMYQDYGTTQLDYTGRLMLMTMKLTYVAFSLHDGLGRREEELSPGQRRQRIVKIPNPLEYFSYMFHFSMLLAGPTCTFNEFTEFVEGTDTKKHVNGKEPSPTNAALQNIGKATSFAAIYIILRPYFPDGRNGDPEFCAANPFWWRLLFAYVSIAVTRTKYYFVFILSDAIHNLCGLGFNGYDDKGKPLWDRERQVNVEKIEFATDFRTVNVNWNIQASVWLRSIVYERVSHNKVAVTYVTSAVWHGFYPGYYLFALASLPYNLAERKVKKFYAHMFDRPPVPESVLKFVQWLVTCLILTYCSLSFPLQLFSSTMVFYRSMYFYGHIACIATLLLVPRVPTARRETADHKERHPVSNGTTSQNTIRNNNLTHQLNDKKRG